MSTKLLNATLLVGSVGAGAGGTYAGYDSQYGTGGPLTEETSQTQPTDNQEPKENILPEQGKVEKQALLQWIEAQNFKECSIKVEKAGAYKELKDTSIEDSDIAGLKDFLEKEKSDHLCSGASNELKLKKDDKSAWSIPGEAYRTRKLIYVDFANDQRKCTFKFKAKGSEEYKVLGELKEEETAGLFNFLNDNKDTVCPKLSGQVRDGDSASNEEKIEYKGDKWEHNSEEAEEEKKAAQ